MMVAIRKRDMVQDERELKRIRRKQSNRESARRSRQKKQAECEDLQAKVQRLDQENTALRQENLQLRAKLDVSNDYHSRPSPTAANFQQLQSHCCEQSLLIACQYNSVLSALHRFVRAL